jgi:DNA-binding FadR family transcriptional regulator
VEVVSRAAVLADQIEAAIVDGAIPAGSRLGTKEDLRRQYDVAYGTLNEALRILQQRGYVTSRTGPGGGLFASAPNPTLRLSHLILGFHEGGTLGDCAVVREALEGPLALDAARSRTPADVRDLEAIVARMGATSDDPHRYLLENWQLHRRIAQICRNRVLGNLYGTLLDANEAELRGTTPTPLFASDVQHNLDVHRQLVAAIAAGSEEQARRAVRAHQAFIRQRPADRPLIPARPVAQRSARAG